MIHPGKSLARRIAWASVLISTLSGLGLGGMLAIADFRRSFDTAVESNARIIAAALPQLESAYWDLDLASVQTTLARLAELPLTDRLWVRDLVFSPGDMAALKISDLSAVAVQPAPGFWALSRILPEDWLSGGEQLALYGRASPAPVALLELRLSFAALYDELGHRALSVVLTTVLQSLLIAGLLFWLMRSRIILPLDALARAARSHRETGTFRLAGLRGAGALAEEGDEIAALAQDFTRTVTRMERYRDHLREEVDQRTAELLIARNEALAASRAKSVFLANMSHELRTPLNAITGLSDLLLAGGGDPVSRGYVTDMRFAAQQLLGSIDQVLDFSKLEAGQMVYAAEPCRPEQILDETLAEARALAAGNPALRISATIAPDVPALFMGDGQKLTQILLNLASNAVKFTPAGRVSLRIRLAGERLVFSVFDSGRGLSREESEAVFRPFIQADGSASRDVSGTGLGLAIAAEMAAGMGGRLQVTSRSGRGSLFSLTLPLAGVSGGGEPLLPRPALGPMTHGARRVMESRLQRICGAAASGLTLIAAPAPARGYLLMQGARLLQPLPADPTHRELSAALRRVAGPDPGQGDTGAWAGLRAGPGAGQILGGCRILLIEDRPINRDVVLALLSRAGAEVAAAPGGREALDLWKSTAPRKRFDLILTDLHMPGLDGFATIAALRAAGAGGVPVVALSADVSTATREACDSNGFQGFIGKPLTEAALLGELRRVLEAGDGASLPDGAGEGSSPPRSLAGAHPAKGAPAILDQEALLRHAGGSGALAARWLAALPEEMAEWRRMMDQAAGGAPDRELLHAICGAAAQIGARALADLCRSPGVSMAALAREIDLLSAALPGVSPPAEGRAAPAPVASVLAEALAALRGHEMRGFDLALTLVLPEGRAAALQDAARRLDFRAAVAILAEDQAA